MRLLQKSVVNVAPIETVSSSPQLFWIGTQTSDTCLWPRVRNDHDKRSGGAPLQEFIEILAEAKSRVWIMDTHFDGESGYAVIQPALELALEEAELQRRSFQVRILTGRLKELESWFREKQFFHRFVEQRQWGPGLHDRYALVDMELWHFGSTVGGGHPDLSCATRGWFDQARDFSQLFQNWWEKAR